MIELGKTAKRKQDDYKLSRYACYLIVQNADSKKKIVALGQTYFAVQTRKKELLEKEYADLTEDEKRFYMNYINKNLKSINQNKTIGIIICKKENKYEIEY